MSVDDAALGRLAQIITSPTNEQFERGLVDELARFDDVSLPSRDRVFRPGNGEVRATGDGRLLLEAVLHPQLSGDGEPDPEAIVGVLDDWTSFITQLGGDVNTDFVREDQGLQFTPLVLPQRAIPAVVRFTQLRVLRPVPQIRRPPESAASRWRLEEMPYQAPPHAKRVAVFDGGVDREAPGLAGYVNDEDLTGGTPVLPEFLEHGTAVCSATLYGHLDPARAVEAPHTAVDHFRVWPPPADHRHDADLMWVLGKIEEVIARGHHRVAVISLGPDLSIEDYEPHAWTTVIDRLAVDHDILFVIAAGNTGDLAPDVNRLLVPADAVNGLSVGSCTATTGPVSCTDYSSRGPGRPGGRTAPNGVQFGGDFASTGFGALLADGSVGDFEGTSFSAPVAARGVSELDLAIEQGASANLLRTLAVHFAEAPTPSQREEPGASTSEVGYGRLRESYAALLDHVPSAVTVVSEGYIRRRQQITIPFTIPLGVFADFPTRDFRVRWTLGFLGPVEPANPVDYSCGGLRVVFRPHIERYTLSPPNGEPGKPFEVTRSVEPAVYSLYAEQRQWRVSKRPVPSQKTGYAPEVTQRARDGKWETLVRMERTMRGSSLRDPCIDLHMLGRESGTLTDIEDLQFSFVLTIHGPPECAIYDKTVAYATALVPLTTSVPVTVRASA